MTPEARLSFGSLRATCCWDSVSAAVRAVVASPQVADGRSAGEPMASGRMMSMTRLLELLESEPDAVAVDSGPAE